MRVVLTSFGTTGDNAPIIALAEALRAEGDAPLLLLNPLYEAEARARQLPFSPVGERWSPDEVADAAKYLHPQKGAIAIWNDFYLPNVARTFAAVRRAIAEHQADAVVSHWLSFGAHFAARAAGVRHGIVNLAPCWWYSRADPSSYSAFAGPRWLLRWFLFLPRLLVNHFIGRSLRAVCAELGVAHRREIYFDMFRQADLNLALWSPAFRPTASDDPARATICGFPFGDGSGALDPALDRFFSDGEPPLVVGLGSSIKTLGDEVYRNLALACSALGKRALLVGARPDAAAGLPGVLAVASAPFHLVFPRARAVVHHGGIGTLAEAVRAGRPAAVVPFANDQHDNARRAQALGVSLTWSRNDLRATRLRTKLEQLFTDESLRKRAAGFGATVSAEPNGVTVAARLLRQGAKV
jgi:UDP:flavonoid glycosyltransferase YjiC (YdhE family)